MPSYSFAVSPFTIVLAFISSDEIIITTLWIPFFLLPGPTGNELYQRIGLKGGSVGGQGHTCVYNTAACVSPPSVVEIGHQTRPRK